MRIISIERLYSLYKHRLHTRPIGVLSQRLDKSKGQIITPDQKAQSHRPRLLTTQNTEGLSV